MKAATDPSEETRIVSEERYHPVFKADDDLFFLIVGLVGITKVGVIPEDVVNFVEEDAYGVVRGDEVLRPEIDNVVLEVSLSTFINLVVYVGVENDSPVVSAYLHLPGKSTKESFDFWIHDSTSPSRLFNI